MRKFLLFLLVCFLNNFSFSQVTLSYSVSNVSCFGGSDGTATVTASGGTAPYSYTWTPGGMNNYIVTGLSAGNYILSVTDAVSNTASVSIQITEPMQLSTAITSVTNVSCFGACNGGVSVMSNGGTPSYSYWLNGTPVGPNINALCAGTYDLMTVDANNCISTNFFNIIQPSQVVAVAQSNNVSCGGTCDGSAYSGANGGTGGYTYVWMPGSITSPMAYSLCPGIYSLTVTDANGCAITLTTAVNSNGNGPLTGVTPTLTVYNESCYLSGDGAFDLQLGGTNPGPFTYQWSNGATTQDISNLTTNWYTVNIFDANMNCLSLSDTMLYDGTNCGVITGNLYFDNNGDCTKNSGDTDFISATVMANPGPRYGYVDAAGNYTIYAVPYGSYTITATPYQSFINSTCTNTLIITSNSVSPNSYGNDFSFASTMPTQPDILVSAWSPGIVPGFTSTVNYYISNLSPFNGSGIFKATLPSVMMAGFVSATPSYTISGDTIMWNFNNVNYYNYSPLQVSFVVPIGTTLGSSFTTCMWAITTVTDLDPTNNTDCYTRTVTGSFDPNDKSVSPVGTGSNGNITVNDKELTYLIRFQNTGNGPAVNIVVKDSISANLDMSTFQMLNASHTYAVDVLPGNVVRWKFNNIMLPDSNSNEPGSHGFIQYRIKQKANNPIGTQIKNTAYIYFDFNDPVITNTTLNTIAAPVGIMEVSKNDNLWSVYPNPSNGILHISNNSGKFEETQLQIVNAIGQLVYNETMNSNYKTIDLSKYNNGVYFIKMASDKNSSVKRIVLNK